MTFDTRCIVVSALPTLPLVCMCVGMGVCVCNERQSSPNVAIRAVVEGKWSKGKWRVCRADYVRALVCVNVGGVIIFCF